MALSLNVAHLRRYKQIAALLLKYGRSDLVKAISVDGFTLDEPEASPASARDATELATDLEELGPTFVKLGQLLSTRADLLPAPYLEALSRLQDHVAPFPYSEVQSIVGTELGMRLNRAYASFERKPIAAASLAQVHKAKLPNGRVVAVKVQRPDIRERVLEDLELLDQIAAFMDAHTDFGRRYELGPLVAEFRKGLLHELDYRQEARNLIAIDHNLRDYDSIVVPLPVDDHSTARVLTMDFIKGRKVTEITPLAARRMDGPKLADDLFRAYLQQILIDGLVHADPHPGNVFVTTDGRVALVDLGMVVHIPTVMQERLLQLLLAASEGRGDEAATVAIRIGQPKPEFDQTAFRRQITEVVMLSRDNPLEQMQVGKIVLLVARTAGDCGLRVPPELALLGKTLLNLDQVGRALDDRFDPNAAIRRHAAAIMGERMRRSLTPGSLFGTALELKDFVQKLPGRANKILDHIADNDLTLKVDAIDEHLLMEGFQKVANRITTGLVLAALIVGAAMLVRVPSAFTILGYPGLAILLFIAAAGGGISLLFSILLQDRRSARKQTT
jgi:ubiquinone biosynthesis protein